MVSAFLKTFPWFDVSVLNGISAGPCLSSLDDGLKSTNVCFCSLSSGVLHWGVPYSWIYYKRVELESQNISPLRNASQSQVRNRALTPFLSIRHCFFYATCLLPFSNTVGFRLLAWYRKSAGRSADDVPVSVSIGMFDEGRDSVAAIWSRVSR